MNKTRRPPRVNIAPEGTTTYAQLVRERMLKLKAAGKDTFILYDLLEHNSPLREVNAVQSTLYDMRVAGTIGYVMDGDKPKKILPLTESKPHYATSKTRLRVYKFQEQAVADKTASQAKARRRHQLSKETKAATKENVWASVWPDFFTPGGSK